MLPVTFCDLGGGRQAWRAKAIPTPRSLYLLPELLARPDALVIICEGEKTAAAAMQIFPDHVATSPMGGAKAPQQSDWTVMVGRRAIIWPDHDGAGAEFANRVARLVTDAGAAGVSIVDVPADWPEKWDLADPVPDGAPPDILVELLAGAVPWQPPRVVEKESKQFLSFGDYRMTERGLLWVVDDESDDKRKGPVWLSSPFEILAQTRDPHGSYWGLLLRWRDPDGGTHEWAMPREALGGGSNEIWRWLMSGGLSIATSAVNRNRLADYLSQARPEARACGLSRIG